MTKERVAMNDIWREKLKAAREIYEAARERAWDAQREFGHLPLADGGYIFRRANAAETAALSEYARVLQIFNALAVRGEMPPE